LYKPGLQLMFVVGLSNPILEEVSCIFPEEAEQIQVNEKVMLGK